MHRPKLGFDVMSFHHSDHVMNFPHTDDVTLFRGKASTNRKEFNLAILWYTSRYRRYLVGVYFFEDLEDFVPVIALPPNVAEPPKQLFEIITERELDDAYRMVCLRCGACCEFCAGGFVFDHEVPIVGSEYVDRENFEDVEIPFVGRVRVYALRNVKGRCRAFDAVSRTCMVHDRKPIACLIMYCGLVAEKRGSIYVYTCRGSGCRYVAWEGSLEVLRAKVRSLIKSIALRECRALRGWMR